MTGYSQPIELLYQEHLLILKAVENLRELIQNGIDSGKMKAYLNFFREYGDGFHHQKEEDLLFPLVAERSPIAFDYISGLESHHEAFRDYLQQIEEKLDEDEMAQAIVLMETYMENLIDHISSEDNDFFITADELLTEQEKERLFFRFQDMDMEMGMDEKAELEALVNASASVS